MSEIDARAARAARLLEDPDLKQAFADTRTAILEKFSEIPPSETEQLVECRRLLQLLESVEKNLKLAIREGELSRFRADEETRPSFLGDIMTWNKKNKRA